MRGGLWECFLCTQVSEVSDFRPSKALSSGARALPSLQACPRAWEVSSTGGDKMVDGRHTEDGHAGRCKQGVPVGCGPSLQTHGKMSNASPHTA